MSLSTLGQAPAGPKWVMFLSDGLTPLNESLLPKLAPSGVKWRSFAVGGQASCTPSWALAELAAATGEACTGVNAAALAAGVVASRPDGINGVNVTVDGVSASADIDAVGGWRAGFVMGAGTYVHGRGASDAVLPGDG